MCFFKLFKKKKEEKREPVREPLKEETAEEPKPEETGSVEAQPSVTVRPEEAQPAVATENAAAEEATVTDAAEADSDNEVVRVYDAGTHRYIIIKYNKSFTARLIQLEETDKSYYSELKNEILSYKGVKSRISWKHETFRAGRKALIKLRFRGKILSVYFALPAQKYEESKYKVEDVSETAQYEDTPCLYRIKNDRRLRYAKELIAELMSANGLEKTETENIDYVSQLPYETTEALLERKLIKELTSEDAQSGSEFMPTELKKQVSAGEVKLLMRDEVAAALVETSEKISDRSVTGIINIDTLEEYFEDGETVTLEDIKARVKGFNKKVTYIKVLARGMLDKKLFVEADNFSLDAVKMLALTGGKAIKKGGKK